ncbi:hypothetical protein DITRI_Ditri10aG0077100 [Diplodiscus trichospermus]
MVQMEKPTKPSRELSPCSFYINDEVDENSGKSLMKARNLQNKQEQLLGADARIKHEETITELADIVGNALFAFVDHVIAKPPIGYLLLR